MGERYLRRMREAVMVECRNVARPEVLLELAEGLATTTPEFQLERFRADLHSAETADAFRNDLKDARYYEIGRFPTLVIRGNGPRALRLVGYRPYDVLQQAVEHARQITADQVSG